MIDVEALIAECHPDIQAVVAYWRRKAGARRMPSRADIDPAELKPYLARITLVDVVPDARRFVYRLVGTGEVQVRGHDPTGKSVRDGYFAASPDEAMARYERVCNSCAPYYEIDNFQVVDRYVCEANLFLPLSDDDATVNKILVFSINRDLYRR